MNKGIQQRFSQSFLRIIRFFDPLQPFKNRCRPVTEGQIRIAFLQLFENRTAKLLRILEYRIGIVSEYRDFGRMLTLV